MERETLPVDILFVGAGPANLAAAYSLAMRLKEKGKLEETEIAVIEKSQVVGSQILSGAVMDPRSLNELFPEGLEAAGCPIEATVTQEEIYHFRSPETASKLPFIPPFMKNHGFPIINLSDVVVWLKDKLEAMEIMIFEGFPGDELLYDGDKVIGVRTIDKGLNAEGNPGPSFEPGADIEAKCVILGEGPRGSLCKQLVSKLGLEGRNPQVYGTGCKEIWQLPEGRFEEGKVFHSSGWPLNSNEYGGSFIYGLSNNKVSIGFITALDSGNPHLDPWANFQQWKSHPHVRKILEGGEILKAGAKTIPEGGYWSRPRSHGDGFLIIGDSASLLDISRLKGVHTAIKSGLLAADTLAEAIEKDDFSQASLSAYDDKFKASWLHDDLYKVRNHRQDFNSGFWMGAIKAGIKFTFGGIGSECKSLEPDHEAMRKLSQQSAAPATIDYDGKYLIDKMSGVFHSGAIHNEHQPSHLHIADTDICRTKCTEEYGNPCEKFCPAGVYEMLDDEEQGGKKMHLNFSNCVHCKTCDILDPYEIITWKVPSDAGGPKYQGM